MPRLTQIELDRLGFESDRGRLAQNFTSSQFFRNYLLPYLNDAKAKIAMQNAHVPNMVQDLEKIALTCAINAGKIDFIGSFFSDLERWITEGEEARKKLTKEVG